MTRSTVHVRPADVTDAQALAHLVRGVGTRTGVFSGRPLLDPSPVRLAERFTQIITDGERELLVAVDATPVDAAGGSRHSEAHTAGQIVGMLAARSDDIGAIDLTRVLHVTHLMVDPHHRRRGVGRALLTGAVELAERLGVEHVLATTASGSRESNRYLARLGFTPLVVQRIAQTARLRRSLGMSESLTGAAPLRRARLIRAQRANIASYSAVRGN